MSDIESNGVDQHDEEPEEELTESFSSPNEELLYLARHGKENSLAEILVTCQDNKRMKFNINCKGTHKSNRGWTALHLASYFGHTSVVRVLLEFGADVNILNDSGESPLHLAAYTGREEVVGLLLSHGASTKVINLQNQTPQDITKSQHIKDMIEASESSSTLQAQSAFLLAAATGNTVELSELLSNGNIDINVHDTFGNTALHLAAMRGHVVTATLLLQHGIDSSLQNSAGQIALDLATDTKTKQVLGVLPIKAIISQPQRFEGTLLKKNNFVGFKPVWAVLERGVLSFFLNRGDASTGFKRKGMKYLDEAKLSTSNLIPTEFLLEYSDGSKHLLRLTETGAGSQVNMQKWLLALKEHIDYSTHYIHQGEEPVIDVKLIVSLGTMHNSLQSAQAYKKHLEKQIKSLQESLVNLSKQVTENGNGSNNMARTLTSADLRLLASQSSSILSSSQEMLLALTHCMNLMIQQEELREVQLKEERERCRLLQDSLHALATEHLELEKSISRHHSFLSMEEEFFDCDDITVGSPVGDAFADSYDLSVDDNRRNEEKKSSYGRTKLPVPMFSRSDFSFWSILKQCIGKELSKITMPVVFNEPLSFIQRLAEYMEYAPLIEKAANCDNPIERMEYVTAFAISALSSNWERIGKPFNPLLGETFELDRPDLGFRFMGEQVSHHPPITAVYAEGKAYALHGSIQPKLKFWGKTVEISPKGHIYLELHNYKETYTWQNVNCCIHNVIVGSLWVEHYGTMEITCNNSNVKAVVNFHQSGWFAKDLHHVDGYIYDGKKKERALYGSWVLGIYSCPPNEYDKFVSDTEAMARYRSKYESSDKKDKENQKATLITYNYQLPGQKTLWLVNPRSPESAEYYHFSLFSMTLNELLPGMLEALPPTDSRLRPDIRSMEEGKIDQSAEEKNRVEEKQREARKERKKKSKEWQPRWFTLRKVGGHEEWIFNRNYWQRNWQDCADIF
uniref:Oxysterol-binding protein n=1 Tax=Biomphalaria glabrata TaxID=6526 RepID=A0A2C9KC96_BIOGL